MELNGVKIKKGTLLKVKENSGDELAGEIVEFDVVTGKQILTKEGFVLGLDMFERAYRFKIGEEVIVTDVGVKVEVIEVFVEPDDYGREYIVKTFDERSSYEVVREDELEKPENLLEPGDTFDCQGKTFKVLMVHTDRKLRVHYFCEDTKYGNCHMVTAEGVE